MKNVLMRAAALAMCLSLVLCGLGLAEQPREFVDAPQGAKVFGVTVGEPLRMGVALARAARSITYQFDAADFDISGADALLNSAEYGALGTLDPMERVLAVLIMAGYEDETYNAMDELRLDVSDEARALVAAVYKRYTEMSKSERSAYRAAVERYFPNEDGVRVTLRIGEQLIRYSFQKADAGWMLNGISVAK